MLKKLMNKKITKGLLQFGILLVCLISVCIYFNNEMNKKEKEYTTKISELQNENHFKDKDVETYKYLYDQVNKSNLELQNKYDIEHKKVESLKKQIAESKDIIMSRGSYVNKDLRTNYSMTEPQLNDWIKQRAPEGSPFIGRADIFIKASQQTGLDPKYIVSHAALESEWGKSSMAREKNNFFGINARNENPNLAYGFAGSMEEGIINGARWIKDHYIDKGQSSLNQMIYGKNTYCETDGGAPAQSWIDQIANIIFKG